MREGKEGAQAPSAGFLGLYLKMYDDALPQYRPGMDEFYATICRELRQRGLQIHTVPLCRERQEFEAAVRSFEDTGVDVIITLHLAYSPSLESADVLAATRLPLIVLDTTPAREFGPTQSPGQIMYNHGIHGVQDLCNLLIRRGKAFDLEVGHFETTDVLDRVAARARGARMANAMRSARVGRIGGAFAGMGDFAVPDADLREDIGAQVVQSSPDLFRALLPAADDPEVLAEVAADREAFVLRGEVDPALHTTTVRAGIAVRRWMRQEGLSAFTFNFLDLGKSSGLPTVPFLEASKTLAGGQGYAGEGDTLTAALCAALASTLPEVTFTEMFCPDWDGDRLFVSHMGELNVALTASRPELAVRDFTYTDADNPIIAYGRMKGGQALLVNLAPGPDRSYRLIIAPVEVDASCPDDSMAGSVRGWFRTSVPLADFLCAYSKAGGTHHCALVYGRSLPEIRAFGETMGWKVTIAGGGNLE